MYSRQQKKSKRKQNWKENSLGYLSCSRNLSKSFKKTNKKGWENCIKPHEFSFVWFPQYSSKSPWYSDCTCLNLLYTWHTTTNTAEKTLCYYYSNQCNENQTSYLIVIWGARKETDKMWQITFSDKSFYYHICLIPEILHYSEFSFQTAGKVLYMR